MDQPIQEIFGQLGIVAPMTNPDRHGAMRSLDGFKAVAREDAPADCRQDCGRACGG